MSGTLQGFAVNLRPEDEDLFLLNNSPDISNFYDVPLSYEDLGPLVHAVRDSVVGVIDYTVGKYSINVNKIYDYSSQLVQV